MSRELLLLFACAGLALICPGVAGANFDASPATLLKSSDKVTLSWTGVGAPTTRDTISISVKQAGPSVEHNIGWLKVTDITGYGSGSAHTMLPLVNMRVDYYIFRYLAGNGTTVATSNKVGFANPQEHLQVHLSATGTFSEMRVMWVTAATAPSLSVQFGRSAGALRSSARSTRATYTINDMCGSVAKSTIAWMDPGYSHDAMMTGLAPSTRYYYRVGGGASGWSDVFSFVSAPLPASLTHLFAFGDVGVGLPYYTREEQQPPALRTLRWVGEAVAALREQSTPAAVLHNGDISYARGWGYLWEEFMTLVQPVASAVPYMVAIGNHEADDRSQKWQPTWSQLGGRDSQGECGVPFHHRFHMPGPVAALRNIYYSFDFGSVHVSVISLEHDYSPGSPQWLWLQRDLRSVNRTHTPWLIVTGHRPMYSSSAWHDLGDGRNNQGQDAHQRWYLEPLLTNASVDLALWAHVHVYERTCGMSNFTCAPSDNDATVHVTIGSAGNVYCPDWASDLPQSPSVQDSSHHEQPQWSVFRTMNFGYTHVVADARQLRLRFMGDQRGLVHDSLTLTKKRGWRQQGSSTRQQE